MKIFQFKTYSTLVVLIFYLLYPAILSGQDLTESELEELQIHRERLIQEGYLHLDEEIPLLQSLHSEPIIVHASYTNKSASFATENSRATDFNANGTRFYILGRATLNIVEYHLSNAWDIESGSIVRELDISPEMGSGAEDDLAPHGLFFRKNDGTRMWVFNRTEIWEYTLSTPWDVTTATQTGYKDLSSFILRGHDIDFKPDGSVLYVDDRVLESVFQFNLSTAWEVETASLDYILDISSKQEEVRGTQFNSTGDRMYLMDTARQDVLEYFLSDPYDLRSAGFIGNFSVRSQTLDPRGLTFKPDFTAFYVTSADNNRVFQYEIRYVDPDESSITADHFKVVANGSDTSRITVTLRDKDRVRLEGRKVSITSKSSNVVINPVNSTTHSNGEARFDVHNSSMESVTFQASAMGTDIDESVTVRFMGMDPDESSLTASGEKVLADGTASESILVTARDEEGDVLQGVEISILPDGGSSDIEEIRKITNSNGVAEFRVSNQVAERVTYQAKGMGITINQAISISFVTVDPSLSTVSVSPSRKKVLANGTASGSISVTARDEEGDVLQGVEISILPDGGSSDIEEIRKITNSNGVAEFRVSNQVAERVTYQARGMGITINQSISISFVTVDPSLSTVSVSPSVVQADNEEFSNITILTRDADGDILVGASVTLEPQSGSSTIQAIQNITDNDGEAFFRVRNSKPESVIYTLFAENIELEQKAEVNFVPIAPVSLVPKEVGTRSFIANWELVDGAETYLLDVATDSSFSSLVAGFQNKDVGNTSSVLIENLNPGRSYYYRVRAMSMGLISTNSEIIGTTTYPETPVALPASDLNALNFIAIWEAAEGAEKYRIDVATDHQFEQMVDGYKDAVVEEGEELVIDGLEMGTSYFYRLRSVAGPRVSPNSNSIEATTLTINSDHSEISFAQFRVLADGNQSNEIRIIVKSDEGYLLKGLEVELVTEDEQSEIEAIQPITDPSGLALFFVKSSKPGKVNYQVVTEGIILGEVTVEFLEADGKLKLGDNFPNPFRSETRLPVTVPGTMEVQLTVYNSIGMPVRTVLNETLETGYYEVLFNMDDLASGVYFYRLIADGKVKIGKLVLVK